METLFKRVYQLHGTCGWVCGVVTERRCKMRSLRRHRGRSKEESKMCPVNCFLVLVGGVTTRGCRGPAVTLIIGMKAWGY